MRFRYPHAVIPLFSTMNTQTISNSTPFSNLQKSLFLQTRFFQPKIPFFTVFCSKRGSKFPPLPLKTNGYHGVSTAKVPRPGKVFYNITTLIVYYYYVTEFLFDCFWDSSFGRE
jgi:hypothetical protein